MKPKKHKLDCRCHGMSRRDFLTLGAATGAGLILPGSLQAADNIRDMQGTVFVNRKLANVSTSINPGDLVTVAHGGKLSFVVGEDAYVLRGGSSLLLEMESDFLVKGLRLLTGGLLAVFGKGRKTIQTRTTTIGIRGTGIYLDTAPDKTFFCTCYGETEVRVEGAGSTILSAKHHDSAWIKTPSSGNHEINRMGEFMGEFAHHNDDELRAAEALVGRSVPFDS